MKSTFTDINIFHFFSLEINAICKAKPKSLYLEKYIDDPVNRWRADFIRALGIEVHTSYIKCDTTLEVKGWLFDSWTFVQYLPDKNIMQIPKLVKMNLNISDNPTDIVFIKRDKSRILYDLNNNLLDEVLLTKMPHMKVVNFDNCSFYEQVSILSKARVMISCHGAANTNLIFLPTHAKMIEISFRSHWYCDPICKGHNDGSIDYKTKCNSHGLTYRPYYHKADYHNLAKLCDIEYVEVPLDRAEGYIDDNPINVRKVYVNPQLIIKALIS